MDDVARPAAEDRVELVLAARPRSTDCRRPCKHGKPLRKYQHHGRWQTLPASVPTLRICGVATLPAASASTGVLLPDRLDAGSARRA